MSQDFYSGRYNGSGSLPRVYGGDSKSVFNSTDSAGLSFWGLNEVSSSCVSSWDETLLKALSEVRIFRESPWFYSSSTYILKVGIFTIFPVLPGFSWDPQPS